MARHLPTAMIAVAAVLAATCPEVAQAQKAGGTFRSYIFDNPPSASIHEESTVATAQPFMPVFNNLVIFDQHQKTNTPEGIRPDLATEWAWDESATKLTFKLHQGVKWHDGQPFTAADVKCTWDTILGKRDAGWRKNPRKEWYFNLEEVTTRATMRSRSTSDGRSLRS